MCAMYYPDQRHMIAWATIRRERLLPDNAIGAVEVRTGQHVTLRDIVARGTIPSQYLFVEAAPILGRNDTLEDLMLVEVGEMVEADQLIAGQYASRGRRLFAPAAGRVVAVHQARIVIQATPESIELEAGLMGQVISTRPGRGAVIEAMGALVQGVWGNDRRVIGPLRIEPDDGLESIFDDEIDRQYSGAVVVTRRSIKATTLMAMENQNLGGVIAPSMDVRLVDEALRQSTAILLTDGFGSANMNGQMFSLFAGMESKQASLDAYLPSAWEARRPEVFINLPPRSGERPPAPPAQVTLQRGMNVRLTRAPHVGAIGKIVDLPKPPQMLDNGLRVPCAQVDLATGEDRKSVV